MKRYYILIFPLCLVVITTARTGSCSAFAKGRSNEIIVHEFIGDSLHPLKIGDRIPDITFTDVLNYKSKSLRLSDFKDKIVVLDFWATWCSSCLAKFPEEKALQSRLFDNLQIILVNSRNTRDTHAKVIQFFKDRHQQYDFPSIDQDVILTNCFPSQANPHYAWIKNNIVVAIPEPEALTESNVRSMFQNTSVSLVSDVKHRVDFRETLFKNSNQNNIRYYSFIGAYRQDLYPSFNMEQDSLGMCYRIDAVNLSLMDMIQFCSPVDSRRIVKNDLSEVISADSTSLLWREKHRFVYESTFASRTPNAALTLLRGDIERYFNFRIDTISRDTTCLIISVSDTSKIVHGRKGVHGETNILDHLNTPIFFRNTSIPSIASLLEDHYKIPVINDTHLRYRVILDLPANLDDFNAIAVAFLRQGLRIERAHRKVTYLSLQNL